MNESIKKLIKGYKEHRTNYCDVCNKKTKELSDWIAVVCRDCRDKYNSQMNILSLIGHLYNDIELLIEYIEKTEKTYSKGTVGVEE